MKSTSVKGLKATGSAKSFSSYTGNVKSKGSAVPSGKRNSPAGGKVKANLGKKVVVKKPGKVYSK